MNVKSKAELQAEIDNLTAQLASKRDPSGIDATIDLIRKIIRAKNGLPVDDDVFNGLIQVKDIRERTRLQEHDIYGHSFMRLLAEEGGEEWAIMAAMADMEDPYFISLDGEQRKEAILLSRARTGADMQNLNINLPNTNPNTLGQEPPDQAQAQHSKKSWIPWRR